MRKPALLLVFLLLHTMLFHGQSQYWLKLNSGTTLDLNTVFFANDQTGWVAGVNGLIMKSTNGGNTWTQQNPLVSVNLNASQFVNTSVGWIVGNSGKILYTPDGGSTWVQQTSGTIKTLKSLFMVNASTGWIVGEAGTVLYTNNGGTTWASQPTTYTTNFNTVYFVDSFNGWIGGAAGLILKTTDAGTTWSVTTSNTAENINCISGSVAVGNNGTILNLNASGMSWSNVSGTSTVNLNYAYDASLPNQRWLVGNNGTLLNGSGATQYIRPNFVFTDDLLAVNFVTSLTGWAVGKNGAIIRYANDVGIKEQSKNEFTVYPNPFNETLSIKTPNLEKGTEIEIHDYLGKLCYKGTLEEDDQSINTSELKPGMYILQLGKTPGTQLKLVRN